MCITMDNWFTGIFLARKLYNAGIYYMLGTIGAPGKPIAENQHPIACLSATIEPK